MSSSFPHQQHSTTNPASDDGSTATDSDSKLPSFVEVSVEGVIMRWPTALVVVSLGAMKDRIGKLPHRVEDLVPVADVANKLVASAVYDLAIDHSQQHQQGPHTPVSALHATANSGSLDKSDLWNFRDPLQKSTCNCGHTSAIHPRKTTTVHTKAELKVGLPQSIAPVRSQRLPFHKRSAGLGRTSPTISAISPAMNVTVSNGHFPGIGGLQVSTADSQGANETVVVQGGATTNVSTAHPQHLPAEASVPGATNVMAAQNNSGPTVPAASSACDNPSDDVQFVNTAPVTLPQNPHSPSDTHPQGKGDDQKDNRLVAAPVNSEDLIIKPSLTGAEVREVRLDRPALIPMNVEDNDDYYNARIGLESPHVVVPNGNSSFLDVPVPSNSANRGEYQQPSHLGELHTSSLDLNPSESLPEDFMAEEPIGTNTGAPSNFLSPPPSTETIEDSPAGPVSSFGTGGGGGKGANDPLLGGMGAGLPQPGKGLASLSSISKPTQGSNSGRSSGPPSNCSHPSSHIATSVDYSKIFPTPPTLDPLDHLPTCVYEPAYITYYDNLTTADFFANSELAETGSERKRRAAALPQYNPTSPSPGVALHGGPPGSGWLMSGAGGGGNSSNGHRPPPYFGGAMVPGSAHTPFSATTPEQYPGSVGQPHSMSRYEENHSIEMSPAGGPPSILKTPRTNDSCHGPPSNSSGYIKNLSSVESSAAESIIEANSLALVLLLCDSFINHFTDSCYDICTLCACCNDLCGWERGLYLDKTLKGDAAGRDLPSNRRCNCGFSAIRSRHLAVASGLFAEDEYEITNAWPAKVDSEMAKWHEKLSTPLLDMIRVQSQQELAISDFRAKDFAVPRREAFKYERLSVDAIWRDFRKLVEVALEEATHNATDWHGGGKLDTARPAKALSITKAVVSALSDSKPCDSEILCLLKGLTDVFRDAISRPRGVWEAKNSMEGPLTWRSFHRRCFHGKEDQCEPEPVPALMLRTDRDWLATPPHALSFWDKLLMEPFTGPRDVSYIVVTPDHSGLEDHKKHYFIDQVKNYFRELSRCYETCKFGKHVPILTVSVAHEGVMRITKTHAQNQEVGRTEVHHWFDEIGHKSLVLKLKRYAQACKFCLVPHLKKKFNNLYKLEDGESSSESSGRPHGMDNTTTEMEPPAIPPFSSGISSLDSTSSTSASLTDVPDDYDIPTVVIYMVNPWPEEGNLATIGLIRIYLEVLMELPARLRCCTQLQIVSISQMLQVPSASSDLKVLSLGVYNYARSISLCKYTPPGRSLTGFGPTVLRSPHIPSSIHRSSLAVNRPGCDTDDTISGIFNPSWSLCSELLGMDKNDLSKPRDSAHTLLISYCLSDDQRWLLAAATDSLGTMLDSTVVSLSVAGDRKNCVRGILVFEGIKRLWDWVLGIISTSGKPWRVIMGRLGRLGPTELKCWARHLSKDGLKRISRFFRDQCSQCSQLPAMYENPCILTACLISFEAESGVRIFSSNTAAVDDRLLVGKKDSGVNFPLDISCTHILVFPTSATAQMNSEGPGHPSVQDDDIMDAGMDDFMADLDFGDIGGDGDNLMDAIQDIMASGTDGTQNDVSMQQTKMQSDVGEVFSLVQTADSMQTVNLNNQPMALGYYFSSAPPGPLPDWFWTECPSLADTTPSHFRAALHIKVDLEEDSLYGRQRIRNHMLDSNMTTDVLRCVLEIYSDLSWLNIDLRKGDRRSCLPVHIQSLVRLCNAVKSLL